MVLSPRDERDVCEAVADAAASARALEIVGGGSKRGIGAPKRETAVLSTAGLAKVVDHDPAELVLTVEPGVRLAEIETLLAAQNQMLAFEPFDFAEVGGVAAGGSTIGGVVGAALAGPRRVSAGGVRDHLLGFSAVNGRGEVFKAGGRVVKNVTGYDLSKLMAGSWGQLAVLTQMTLKVVPRPAEMRTLAWRGIDAEAAVEAMGQAMRSQANVAAAAHAGEVMAIRLEGFGPSVDARARMLAELLGDRGRSETLSAEEAEAHWRSVRSARFLGSAAERPVLWRMVVPPAQAAVVAGMERLGGAAMLDWAGALVWARMPVAASPSAVRRLAEANGGHAMLVDAPEDVRLAAPALHPEPSGVAALSRRVREAFDPAGVFDPQRFTAGEA